MDERLMPEDGLAGETERQRPVVVSIIAVAMLLNGVVTLVTGLLYDAQPYVLVLGAVALLLSAGLWKLWAWAWAGTILLQLVALAFAFYDWYALASIDFWAIGMAILIIAYLLQLERRSLFLGQAA